MDQELVHTEECQGFTIKLYLCPEYDSPDWDFESEEEKAELLRKIDNCDVLWFCAKVTASKHNIELAYDYLGGCCYDSIEQFITDGTYADMKDSVIAEAKQTLKVLQND